MFVGLQHSPPINRDVIKILYFGRIHGILRRSLEIEPNLIQPHLDCVS